MHAPAASSQKSHDAAGASPAPGWCCGTALERPQHACRAAEPITEGKQLISTFGWDWITAQMKLGKVPLSTTMAQQPAPAAGLSGSPEALARQQLETGAARQAGALSSCCIQNLQPMRGHYWWHNCTGRQIAAMHRLLPKSMAREPTCRWPPGPAASAVDAPPPTALCRGCKTAGAQQW